MASISVALQLDPGLDQVGGEDVAAEQELVVGLEGVEHAAEAVGHGGHVRVLLGRQLVEVLVDRGRGSVLFWMPSMPAIRIAANARYGFEDGSGQRNSTRLAFGLDP